MLLHWRNADLEADLSKAERESRIAREKAQSIEQQMQEVQKM